LKRLLLWMGVLVPVVYYGAQIAGALSWPGYDIATQYASELGSAKAPHPEYFNWPVMAGGVLAVLSSLGFFLALRERGGGLIPSFLTALCIAAFGVSYVMGGMFPMPNELHNGFGLGLATIPAPLFMLWALARTRAPGLKLVLVLTFLAMVGMNLIMFNIGELNLVRQSNVGLWQRAYSLASIPWLALAALALMGRPRS